MQNRALCFTRYSGNICAVRWKILPPDNFYDRYQTACSKLLKSTKLGRSYSPPKLARFFEPQCRWISAVLSPSLFLRNTFSIHFRFVWNEMQFFLLTETDARRNHDINENYKLLLIIPCRIENVALNI